MTRIKNYLLLFLFIGHLSGLPAQTSDTLFLHSNWMFGEKGNHDCYPAKVPGSVHTDLLANKLIPDPFYGCNEKDLQWIETKTWDYNCTFEADDQLLGRNHVELIAEGLDTYASVFINDQLVISADNMFRQWTADVKDYLHVGQNKIEVVFDSPVTKGKELTSQLPYSLPGDERLFVRKAQYQFGWDWGGRFVGCGIWKPIYLKAWNECEISALQFIQHSLDKKEAALTITSTLISDANYQAEVVIRDTHKDLIYASKNFSLTKGSNLISVDFSVPNPRLWWTHDLGEPYLYHFTIGVFVDNKCLATHQITAGLRTIEVVNDKDADGESFYFKLNGVPVFIKGANYIPQDNFPARVTSRQYDELLNRVVDSRMNMLRVWGGGIYENDVFYDLCDAKGILVWQDFMFACAMYPGDSAYLKNVNEEIIYQVKRLRNHPCITLWCGNNESDEGWHNWGWQKQYNYNPADSAKIWQDYLTLFHKMIPEALKTYDPGRFYWPSSPKIGWGHEQSLAEGDSHYWGVWWGMEPFDVYKKKVGRFASEYGFQGFPEKATLQKAMDAQDVSLGSAALKCHEKHATGFETIETYLLREYKRPKTTEDYIYISQLLQAYGIKTAIEAHRNAKPRCMGTLYWQLNDCWPVVSWSSMDYYHNPKALQYFVKKSFNDLLVTLEQTDNTIEVRLNSDKLENTRAQLELQLMGFDGKVRWQQKKAVTLKAGSNVLADKIDTKLLLADKLQLPSLVFYASLKVNDKVVSDNFLYSQKPKDLALQDPGLSWKIDSLSGKYAINLSSQKLAKNVFIRFENCEGKDIPLSDNFFDMMPNSSVQVYATTPESLEYLKTHIRVSSLFDVKY